MARKIIVSTIREREEMKNYAHHNLKRKSLLPIANKQTLLIEYKLLLENNINNILRSHLTV
jgi:hypothetical protein